MAATKLVKIMFDGVAVDCFPIERNGEVICTAKDGRFVKFPAGDGLADAIAAHNAANATVPLPPPDEAKEAELAAWLASE